MPYTYRSPNVRRQMLASALYEKAPRTRPDWMDDRMLRPGQVATLFQVSRRTISDWARAGKLDSILTPGGHRRFPARQVRALLESQAVDMPPPRP
jgi:excisionase family DNA binding protein